MVLDLLRKNKPAKQNDQERRRNAEILDLALTQRSKLHVQFDKDDSSITGVTANIMSFDDSVVVLEVSGLSALKDRFLGNAVTCFFRVVERAERHREIFYSFQSSIVRLSPRPDRLPQLTLKFPKAIDGTQRRKSLRMKPDIGQFSHIALWKYESSGGFDMARPTVAHAHFTGNLAQIENISAGGLRLMIRRDVVREKAIEPKKGDRFILFFIFAEKAGKLRDEYWLVAKVNNIQPDPISGDMALGLEYIANGVRQPEATKVEWSKIADNVIDDMAQRIYEWHLALYRDKGIL